MASWDGDAWAPFAEMNAVPAADLSLAVDTAGTPVLAWGRYNVTDTFVRVEHWDGAAWTLVPFTKDLHITDLWVSPTGHVWSIGKTLERIH